MNNLSINNQPSFKGGFIINYKKAIPGLREGFEQTVGKHGKQIFENFEGNSDSVLYVMKNSKDYAVSNFIQLNEMKFKYLPDLDTNLRFDEYFPEEVTSYIAQNKPKVISKISELMDYIGENRTQCRARKNSHIGKYHKILNTMGIDITGKSHTNCKGVTLVTDETSRKTAIISPKSKLESRFVAIKYPKKEKKAPEIYAITDNGEIMKKFNSSADWLLFLELFNKAIKHHLHLD